MPAQRPPTRRPGGLRLTDRQRLGVRRKPKLTIGPLVATDFVVGTMYIGIGLLVSLAFNTALLGTPLQPLAAFFLVVMGGFGACFILMGLLVFTRQAWAFWISFVFHLVTSLLFALALIGGIWTVIQVPSIITVVTAFLQFLLFLGILNAAFIALRLARNPPPPPTGASDAQRHREETPVADDADDAGGTDPDAPSRDPDSDAPPPPTRRRHRAGGANPRTKR